jgi:hypothetical protein
MVHTFSRGLSEIVLMVEDALKAAQFYRDVVAWCRVPKPTTPGAQPAKLP